METLYCENCGLEFIASSMAYIKDERHGTLCKMCDHNRRVLNKTRRIELFTWIVNLLKREMSDD